MKKILFFTLFVYNSIIYAQTINWDWSLMSNSKGESYSSSICVDTDRNTYVAGFFKDSIDFQGIVKLANNTNTNMFVVKIDSIGNVKWLNTILTKGTLGKGSITVDALGNVYVAATFSVEVDIEGQKLTSSAIEAFYVKYSNNGQFNRIQKIGSSTEINKVKIGLDRDFNIYLGGTFVKNVVIDTINITTISPSDCYMFYSKLDSAGHCAWIKSIFMDLYTGWGFVDMTIDTNGNGYVAGTINYPVDFGDGVTIHNGSGEAPFIVKYNSQGACQWSRASSDNGLCECFNISNIKNGFVYLTGMHVGNISFGKDTLKPPVGAMEDIFLTKLDTSGNFIKSITFGSTGSGSDFGLNFEPNSINEGYLLGLYSDTMTINGDTLISVYDSTSKYVANNVLLAKFDSTLNISWIKSIGLQGNREFGEIAVSNDSIIFLAGYKLNETRKKSTNETQLQKAFIARLNKNFKSYKPFLEINSQKSLEPYVKLYPNPVSNYLNIMLPEGFKGFMRIYNIEGEIIKIVKLDNINDNQINISSIPSGIYILQINNLEYSKKMKFIKR